MKAGSTEHAGIEICCAGDCRCARTNADQIATIDLHTIRRRASGRVVRPAKAPGKRNSRFRMRNQGDVVPAGCRNRMGRCGGTIDGRPDTVLYDVSLGVDRPDEGLTDGISNDAGAFRTNLILLH